MSRQSLKNAMRLLEMDEKPRPPAEEFLTDLKRTIEIEDTNGRRLPSKTFKPSSMQCPRNSYYQIIGQKPDDSEPSFNFVGICNSGTDIHERTQGYVSVMADNGMDCDWVDVGDFIKSRALDDVVVKSKTRMETKLYNKKYNISFMCDGIIKYKGLYYILEIKTETSNKWFSRTGVDPKHYNQAITYSLSLCLENVIFLYIDRDMLNMKAYLFHVDETMRKSIIDYIEYTQKYVKRKITPPKPAVDRKVCTYCSYAKTCRKER